MIQEEFARSLTVGNNNLARAMLLLLGLGSFTEGKLHQAYEYYQRVLSQAREEETMAILHRPCLAWLRSRLSGMTWCVPSKRHAKH
jgi:hypothetical protein